MKVAVGLGTFVAGGGLAWRSGGSGGSGVSGVEQRVFQAVNGLHARGHAPVWALMQLGSLGGALGVGAIAAAARRPALGRRLAVAGGVTWAVAKAVKTSVGRGRPAAALDVTRVLGKPASGLGYPSGHAAVAASLAAVAARDLGPWRSVAWAAALLVGPTRMYVGAHLPLDVVGGVGLGLAIGTAARSLAPGTTLA